MQVLLSHPNGNQVVRHIVKALNERGLLKEFHTCLHWDERAWLNLFLPRVLKGPLSRRSFSPSVRSIVRTHPWVELGRLTANRFHLGPLLRHEKGVFCLDAVFRDFDLRVSRRLQKLPGLQAVYAYEDTAYNTFFEAERLGIKRIYDLPIGYWRAAREIFSEEVRREPEWAQTITGYQDSDEKLARKDEELRKADRVIVPSQFVRKTLERSLLPLAQVRVVPFGFPLFVEGGYSGVPSRKLRVLFVGSLGQRKGLSYLFRAFDQMSSPHIELTLIGTKPLYECRPLEVALKRHRWISTLPHRDVLREMQLHDVLVLPSLFEGLSLVVLEAMSQGLTVIVTPNTGVADIITDGKDGFIIPIRSWEVIAQKLELLACDRELLLSMKTQACRRALEYGWEKYEQGIVSTLEEVLGE